MTKETISVQWPPVPGSPGYDLFENGKKVSSTKRTTAKFGVAAGDKVKIASQAPPAPPSGPSLPVYDVRLSPGWFNHQDDYTDPKTGKVVNPGYESAWLYPHSPSTTYRSPDSAKTMAQRYLLLDPRYEDANGQKGSDEWWFLIDRYWPILWDPNRHGDWGSLCNFHNVAGDAGPGAGVGWGFGTGVSALTLNWLGGEPAPGFGIEPMNGTPQHRSLMPPPARDEWHSYLARFVAGRTDGSTVRPGSLTVWADGSPTVDLQNINTVQRAQAPDGNWYVQRWMQIWEGDYTKNLPIVSDFKMLLSRVGRTKAECLADVPIAAGTNLDSSYFGGSGPNYGPPSIAQVGARLASASRVPA